VSVAITRTAALSGFGAGTHGLARALATGAPLPGMPAEQALASPRTRKLMSRAAYLAARCLAELLRDDARDRARLGYFLGVGASGGALDDVTALLEESIVDGAFSLERFGDRGLAACNPLLAFQLMNNFTMCHGAILETIGGCNSAVFSRGAGTIAALGEAVHAVRAGECDRAIAGAADMATHPVTVAELTRDGFIARGLVPADGAALVLLERAPPDEAAVIIEGCAHASGRGSHLGEAIDAAVARAQRTRSEVGHVVIAPWGPPAGDALRSLVAARWPDAAVVDTAALGDSLAASPALAVIAGVDLLASSPGHVVVVTLGVDGDPGIVSLSRGAP
jgi:3-oxoacyl-(acyl-carrier-protein) synthase